MSSAPTPEIAPLDSQEANAHLARLMGLVVALRFKSGAGFLFAICAMMMIEATRYPGLLKLLTLPCLFAFYLATTGQLLLLGRLAGWPRRLQALGPVLSLLLLAVPAVRQSPSGVAMSLGFGLWLYLGALIEQARELHHPRAQRWFRRWRLVLPVLLLPTVLVPGLAAPLTLIGGMLFLGATLAGWRIWLAELRQSIAEREAV